MGLYSSAELVFGIPILAFDDEGESTKFWDEENEDWIDFSHIVAEQTHTDPYDLLPDLPWLKQEEWIEAHPEWREKEDAWRDARRAAERALNISILTHGHYEDPDNHRAILTTVGVPTFVGNCWDPLYIDPAYLVVSDEIRDKANADLDKFNLRDEKIDFANAKWWLVASYG